MSFLKKFNVLCYKEYLIIKQWLLLLVFVLIGYSIFSFFLLLQMQESFKNNPLFLSFFNIFAFVIIVQFAEIFFLSFVSISLYKESIPGRKEMYFAYGFSPFDVALAKTVVFTLCVVPFLALVFGSAFRFGYLDLSGWLIVFSLALFFTFALNLVYIFSLIFVKGKAKAIINMIYFFGIYIVFRGFKSFLHLIMNVSGWKIYLSIVLISFLIVLLVFLFSQILPKEKLLD